MEVPEEARPEEAPTGKSGNAGLYESLFSSAPDGIVAVDAQGTIVHVNAAASHLFGYDPEELVGHRLDTVLPTQVEGPEHLRRRSIFASPSAWSRGVGKSLRARRKDGREIPVDVNFATVETDEGPLAAAFVRDMRERWSFEERYRALVDSVDAVVWESDIDRRHYTFVSHRAESILGYPTSDLTGATDFWKMHIHPADLERVLSAGRGTGGEPADHVVEYRIKAGNGRWLWIRDIVRVRAPEVGGPPTLSGVMVDVTEAVAVQQYRENLVDVISHEFRTPVTVIQGYAQMLTQPGRAPNSRADQVARQNIEVATRHLSYLLGSITELARLRSGGSPPDLERVASHDLIEEAIEALAVRGRGYQGLIEVLVEPGAEQVLADRRKTVIALVELLDNAAKFSPPDAPIWVGIRAEPDVTVLTVEDMGPGIPDEVRDGLFKPFTQGDMSAIRPTGGAGLGLAVVAGLVEAQRGRVEVETTVGEGTAMHVRLPRCSQDGFLRV